MNKVGLILDIDDTLADTALNAIRSMKTNYGHSMKVNDIIAKYQQPGNVIEWQNRICEKYLHTLLNDSEFLSNLPVVHYADLLLNFNTKLPINLYITSREEKHKIVTTKWLKKNGFPKRKIIFRDISNTDLSWKIKYLITSKLDHNIFVDNDINAFQTYLSKYRGELIWLNRYKQIQLVNPKIVQVQNFELLSNHLLESYT